MLILCIQDMYTEFFHFRVLAVSECNDKFALSLPQPGSCLFSYLMKLFLQMPDKLLISLPWNLYIPLAAW